MAEQYIFTIENLTKAYAKREVLKNIWLAFYPGARSASSAATAPARARCCASWPCEDKDFLGIGQAARRHSRSALCRRSRG